MYERDRTMSTQSRLSRSEVSQLFALFRIRGVGHNYRERVLRSILVILACFTTTSICHPVLAQPVTGNLVVTNVTVTPSPAMSGQNVTVGFIVTNNGPGLGQMSGVSIYVDNILRLDDNQLFNFSAGQVRSFTATGIPVPVVPAGQSRSVPIRVEIDDVSGNVNGNIASTSVTVNGPACPDITHWTPPGWCSPIVVSNVQGTTTCVNPIPANSSVFVDIAWQNTGGSMPTGGGGVQVELLRNSSVVFNQPFAPMPAGQMLTQMDIPLGVLGPGDYSLVLRLDGVNSVQECGTGGESNNTFTRTFTVSQPLRPNLAFQTPAGWPNAIIVSNVEGTLIPVSPLFVGDSAYVDLAVTNSGNAASGSFVVRVRLDGAFLRNFPLGSLASGASTQLLDRLEIPSVSIANASLTYDLDPDNQIVEQNESDNSRTASFAVIPVPCAADFNRDGTVDSADFFDFLVAFFALAMPADFNQDGVVNTQDFFDFVAAFFTPC